MSGDEKARWAERLRRDLAQATALRAAARNDPDLDADRTRLRAWQAARLARSHADLLASPRYGAAARFFLDELYGPKDFSARDEEVARILPTLIAVLPAAGIRTLALAVEVDALSEELDAAMAVELRRAGAGANIGDDAYAAAYRRCGRREARELQISLVGETGEALALLVRKPLVHAALRLMRGPAKLAGLAGLQQFLEDGYRAFRGMGNAEGFLATIRRRETAILQRLFEGAAEPFAGVD
ncbi:MAG TPA: hypothetical protein PKC23_06700 [Candidatus Desulfobacillus sp.]|nr:hypothetical protein [Candidatus Desulfobacillus sp.]